MREGLLLPISFGNEHEVTVMAGQLSWSSLPGLFRHSSFKQDVREGIVLEPTWK